MPEQSKTCVSNYRLEVAETQTIQMPAGAQILNVFTQYGRPVIYAIGDAKSEKVERCFLIVGTGTPYAFTEKHTYIGSFFLSKENYTGHCFEILP